MRDLRDDPHARSGPGFNRRDFLRGSGAAAVVTAIATSDQGAAGQDAAAKKNVASAAPQDVTLNVNGKDHKLKLEPRVTLLDALRDDLSLTGCKDVCDTTNCGACTVLIDGKATYACTRLAIECVGKKITTVESLNNNGQVDRTVSCFVKHDALQCGFCTPGFVMATKAFCDANPGATIDQIRKGLGGNICRCGTYDGITKCALELVQKGGK